MKCPKCGNTETNPNGDCTYCIWKGNIGPGAKLKEIIKERVEEKPTIDLGNMDGNAFSMLGTARKALKRAGYSSEDLKKFTDDATSGDYDHVLQVIFDWCEVM